MNRRRFLTTLSAGIAGAALAPMLPASKGLMLTELFPDGLALAGPILAKLQGVRYHVVSPQIYQPLLRGDRIYSTALPVDWGVPHWKK